MQTEAVGWEREGLSPSSEELLAEVAHDLRGYITVIKGYAQLLEAEALTGAEAQRDASQRIERTCTLMTELVESCLELERPRGEQVIDPDEVLRECLALHAATARSKSIELCALAPKIPHLAIDGGRLRRIICNLLGNAIKFSPCGRRVVLSAHLTDRCLAIAIEDEGPGLARHEIPTIFRRRQLGSARATFGERGHGLGLAIVRRLVHECRGELRVRSEPGRGSTFTVILPVTRIAA